MKHTTFCLVLSLLMPALAGAADYPPTDHGGADLVLADGDTIWGEHSNIGTFTIPAGATVRVREYDPAVGETGGVRIVAREIVIAGTLDARGSGYTGGGGGGAPCVSSGACFQPCDPNSGDATPGGGGRYAGFTGQAGTDCFLEFCFAPFPRCNAGRPGASSPGDGPFGGAWTNTDPVADDGGYAGPPRPQDLPDNGDSSRDESILLGSGGAGKPGDYRRGGDAGGCGGGKVALVASSDLAVLGAVLASGRMGNRSPSVEEPPWPEGADSWPPGDAETGYGAGGGILLKLEPGATVTFGPDGRIESLCGGGYVSNGGSLKLAGSFPPIPSNFEVSVGKTIPIVSFEPETPTASPTPTQTPTPTPPLVPTGWILAGGFSSMRRTGPTLTLTFAEGRPTRSREED